MPEVILPHLTTDGDCPVCSPRVLRLEPTLCHTASTWEDEFNFYIVDLLLEAVPIHCIRDAELCCLPNTAKPTVEGPW